MPEAVDKLASEPAYPWPHRRRFNAVPQYFRRSFGGRLQKVSIDAGFSCPNRDGSCGTGGCTFCNNEAFNPAYCDPAESITTQIERGIAFQKHRYHKPVKHLAYFQAFSNTHAPVATLRTLYEEALKVPEIAGLVIGTRPDCLDPAKLDLLSELSERALVFLEIGIESCHDRSLERVKRGHDYACAAGMIEAAAARGLHVGTHVIFGLPGETRADWRAMAPALSALPIQTLKCHQLQLLKGTALLTDYARHPEDFDFPELDEYLDFLVDFLDFHGVLKIALAFKKLPLLLQKIVENLGFGLGLCCLNNPLPRLIAPHGSHAPADAIDKDAVAAS